MTYRDAIMSRCSVRTFKRDPVGDDALSTVLWAAYGRRDDGSRTVHGIDGLYSTVIYVFRGEAAYIYNPFNHSLVVFEEGDLRNTVNWQHVAPIQLGLVWDTTLNSDAHYSSVEMGEIGQNIYFMACALGLGTVTAGLTGFDDINLPEHHVGRIVMPLGYPQTPPVFEYKPNILSFLPKVQDSDLDLKTVIEERREDQSFAGDITRQELSHLLWAAYGFSYLLDITDTATNEVQRHRTVPSAACLYPLALYAVSSSGIFRYYPHILHLNPYSDNPYYSTNWGLPVASFLLPIRMGDYRDEIAQASSQPHIASAPLIIISVLPLSSSYPATWYWYYEAGAIAYNIMLESTLLELHAGLAMPMDHSSLTSILRLFNDALPLMIVPVGH
jgi:nitroreductase